MADASRRLAAVMLTDLVGYTALTQRDEAAALRLLDEHRQIVRPLLREHAGREIKTIGDAFLVEFANALDAARCAVALQKAMHERNARTAGTKIELRIGLHVGDVVHDNGDISGDAVNLVSRVEPLAEPGGICLSGPVYDQVRNKLDLPIATVGTPVLKNVEVPVSLYRVELPWAVTSLARETPWVPRPAEQEILRQAVERAGKGEGAIVVLVGESGVGKTRLADETIRAAEKLGFRALRGRAFPGELAAPYSHWVGMIRDFLQEAPAPLVQRAGWDAAEEVAKIVPEMTGRVGPPAQSPAGDPEAARIRFYEGVTRFFVNVSQEGPLLLLLDDLQWAEAASLRLLQFAAQSVGTHRILLLATYHELEENGASPLAGVLRDLRKDRVLTTVPVPRMDRSAVGTMIGKFFGEAEVSDEFLNLVHERTRGNPFFVEEVLRSLVEEGAVYRTPEGRWDRKKIDEIGIPKTVREIVKQRFNRLDEATQTTLRVAAVLGIEFPVEVLREVAEIDEDRLIEQLERLVRAGLLEERRPATRFLSFAFTDVQLRDILYREMLSLRRIRYHRRAGEALEKLAGNRQQEFAGDLAYHFREGQSAAKARDYAVLAAERSVVTFAFDEAEKQLRTALEILEEAPDNAVRARVLQALGWTDSALGRTDRTVSEWEAAIRHFEAAGNPLAAGNLCRVLADLIRLRPDLTSDRPRRFEELLERAQRLLESLPPSRELALLYEQRAVWLADMGGRLAEARSVVDRALQTARAIDDKDMEMALYDELAFVVPVGEQAKVLEYLEAKERYFSRPGHEDWEQLLYARNNLSNSSLCAVCDPPGALRWSEKAMEIYGRVRHREWEAFARARYLIPALLWMGETSRAEEELRRVRDLLALQPGVGNLHVALASAGLALARGDLDEAARRLSSIELKPTAYNLLSPLALLRADLCRERGERDEATRLLREALAVRKVPPTAEAANLAIWSIRLRAALAETLLEGPEDSLPGEEVTKLADDIHELAHLLDHPLGHGLDRRVQGRRARREGHKSEASTHLEEAVRWFRRSGNVLELARTLRVLAESYQQSNQAGRSESCRGEADEILRRLGQAAEPERAVPPPDGPAGNAR